MLFTILDLMHSISLFYNSNTQTDNLVIRTTKKTIQSPVEGVSQFSIQLPDDHSLGKSPQSVGCSVWATIRPLLVLAVAVRNLFSFLFSQRRMPQDRRAWDLLSLRIWPDLSSLQMRLHHLHNTLPPCRWSRTLMIQNRMITSVCND